MTSISSPCESSSLAKSCPLSPCKRGIRVRSLYLVLMSIVILPV